ncbi:mRNA capping enzyme [Syncephalis plumigaleata]|nr:mRNA capping enzyme [Syncephalis plumigaleata]
MNTGQTGTVRYGDIPDVPGIRLDSVNERELRSRVATLLKLPHDRFPGSQPVSFVLESLEELKNENYFVCEKTDGQRCLMLLLSNGPNKGYTYLVDRKNTYRYVNNIQFPILEDPSFATMHHDTLIDGELVLDVESNGRVTLRFMAFDLLAIGGKNDVMEKPFTSRLGYLREHILKPYHAMLRARPHLAAAAPFEVKAKSIQLSYGLEKVLREEIPRLPHKSDGLIFTSSVAGYMPGTCSKMQATLYHILKWKPPHENSMDLQIHLVPSNDPSNREQRPNIELWVWQTGTTHTFYATLGLTDEEWHKYRGQLNEGRIVEVVYDPQHVPPHKWKLLRFRDDKTTANHISVTEKIMKSIQDGVEEDKLLEAVPAIRTAWKQREGQN